MKNLLTAVLIGLFTLSAKAISGEGNTPFTQYLTIYIQIKNALVNGDAGLAASKASVLTDAAKSPDLNGLTKDQADAIKVLNDQVLHATQLLSVTKDLTRQREHFAALSENMRKLAKIVKLSGQPIYEQYCPMKKTYWLSEESVIRNPYYGKQMLTCGRVSATLK